MTNVSNKPLKDDTRDKIETQFTDFLGSLTSEEAKTFYQSFFTESEQIMFTKRLAIIALLERDAPFSHIAKVLKVSPATVDRIDNRREAGEYNDLFAANDESAIAERLRIIIKVLIEENLHHYGASGWRWVDRLAEELD